MFVRWTQTELDRLLRERREAQLAKQAASEDAQAQPGEEEDKAAEVPKLDQLLAKKKAEEAAKEQLIQEFRKKQAEKARKEEEERARMEAEARKRETQLEQARRKVCACVPVGAGFRAFREDSRGPPHATVCLI